MTVLAVVCAAVSVSLGAVYMIAASAPVSYVAVNVAALMAAVTLAVLLRRARFESRFADAATVAIGLLLVVVAVLGVRVDGTARWISINGLSLQPSLILLPLAIMQFSKAPNWWSSSGLTIASIGLSLQPDRAMAGTLAAGVGVLWLYRRDPPVTVAVIAALAGFAVTLARADSTLR